MNLFAVIALGKTVILYFLQRTSGFRGQNAHILFGATMSDRYNVISNGSFTKWMKNNFSPQIVILKAFFK